MCFSLMFFLMYCPACTKSEDGKLQADSDSGEFWVLFGGFAPIAKKLFTEDDFALEIVPAKLYR